VANFKLSAIKNDVLKVLTALSTNIPVF